SCPAWTSTGTIRGGTVRLCDPSKPLTGSYSTILNATKPAPGTLASKDAVRAVVQQNFPIDSNSPGVDSLGRLGDSFSMWWYEDILCLVLRVWKHYLWRAGLPRRCCIEHSSSSSTLIVSEPIGWTISFDGQL